MVGEVTIDFSSNFRFCPSKSNKTIMIDRFNENIVLLAFNFAQP